METLDVHLRRPTQSLENLVQAISGDEAYQDTVIYCSDGPPLILPKLLVGVMFPVLKDCDYFNIMPENCIHLPDYSLVEVKRLFKGELGPDLIEAENSSVLQVDECVTEEVVTEDFYESILADEGHQYAALQVHQKVSKEFQLNPNSILIDEAERTKKKSYKGEIFPGDYPYKCSFCDKRFKQVGHVNHHERKHTGTKKYICEICNKRFNQRSHLLDHTRVHTGEKPFKCTQCDKAYAFSSSLKSHFATHTGERLFKCSFCQKTFNHRANLKAHERLHTGNLKFMCSECGKCFNTKSNMVRHTCRPNVVDSTTTVDSTVAVAIEPATQSTAATGYVTMWDTAEINIINSREQQQDHQHIHQQQLIHQQQHTIIHQQHHEVHIEEQQQLQLQQHHELHQQEQHQIQLSSPK